MRPLVLTLLLTLPTTGLAQAVWLDVGLGYREDILTESYVPLLKFGVRGILPLTAEPGPNLYAAAAYRDGIILDAGGWFQFATDITDPFGLLSYAGVGVTYVTGSVGVALSLALSYDLSPETALTLTYTHRPLFLPEFEQAFDVALGVLVRFD